MKKRVFWFHYNKPESKNKGKPQITVHYKGVCNICDNVIVNVPTFGFIRDSQPHFVMKGLCERFEIKDGVGFIN